MTSPPIIRVPVKRSIPFGYVILGLILTTIFVSQVSKFIFQPDTIGKVSILIWAAIFPILVWAAFRRRKKRHFYITETQAGYDSPKGDDCPCDLDRVRDYNEEPGHISITHDSISVPLGIDLYSQHFAIKDWETVRLALSERIRTLSPNAKNNAFSEDGILLAPHLDRHFFCRRNPRLTDFLSGIVWITLAISQINIASKHEHAWWLIALFFWPIIAWKQISQIRQRLKADLVIGLKTISFESSQSPADKASHPLIRFVEATPYYIKIKHDAGMLPFNKTLLLSHTFFTPQDWEQIQKLVVTRLKKSGITIHRLGP